MNPIAPSLGPTRSGPGSAVAACARTGRVAASLLITAAALLLVPASPALAATAPGTPPELEASQDPLNGMLYRLDRAFHLDESAGITLDYRYPLNPSETVRLSIVSQLLGYYELCKVRPTAVYRQDVVARADYLVANFDSVLSRSAFDGMLGYALLGAYEVTGDVRYFDKAATIVAQNMQLTGFSITLNWGLMAAMGFAKYCALTGDTLVAKKAHDVIASLLTYQHTDGSFAHYCPVSTDIHYTAWMSMELITIGRCFADANIDPILARTTQFLLARVDSFGVTQYREPCASCPSGWKSYYGLATGCPQDYDTRGWINELGYNALVFDHAKQRRYDDVVRFLRSQERHGDYVDKWDYMPLPADPIYRWATGDPSVIRMSVLFWSLASIVAARDRDAPVDDPRDGVVADAATLRRRATEIAASAPPWEATDPDDADLRGERTLFAEPWLWAPPQTGVGTTARGGGGVDAGDRLARMDSIRADAARPALRARTVAGGRVELRVTLPRDGELALVVFDVGGRRVRELARGPHAAGELVVTWDGADALGRRASSGIYLVRLVTPGDTRAAKIVLSR